MQLGPLIAGVFCPSAVTGGRSVCASTIYGLFALLFGRESLFEIKIECRWESLVYPAVVLYEGHCGRVRDGEEDAEQADERDPDEAGGVRVHQDSHLPRVRHTQGTSQANSSQNYNQDL